MAHWTRHIILGILALVPVFLYAQAQDSVRVIDTQAGDKTEVARRKDGTRIYGDTALYQGMSLKLDIGNTILELATSKGKIVSTEVAMNWRLKNRFFPTLELGYAHAEGGAEGGHHIGQGGFGRVGLDISPLKKHPERENILLVGLRLGTALQRYDLTGVNQHIGDYWGSTDETWDYRGVFGADVWGEVVAGCQVQVWEGLQMGWYLRLKILFTRTQKDGGPMPYHIPGFGYRDDTQWGVNYYIGYRF